MDISRRDMFKRVLSNGSLQMLSIFVPGGLELFLDIDDVGSRGSAEEAGLALGRRRRNRLPKLTWDSRPAKGSESKAADLEDSVPEKRK